jgi:hypothetical protein
MITLPSFYFVVRNKVCLIAVAAILMQQREPIASAWKKER